MNSMMAAGRRAKRLNMKRQQAQSANVSDNSSASAVSADAAPSASPEWLEKAALLAGHLKLAACPKESEGEHAVRARDNEVLERARELAALLAQARDGGFGTIVQVTEDQTKDTAPAVEPVPPAAYSETAPLMIVPLAYPFELDGQSFDRLEFRPPSFAMVERVVAGEATELEMHAAMAGIPSPVFRALRWSDAEIAIAAARHIAPALVTRKA